jgi:hypothetical protein
LISLCVRKLSVAVQKEWKSMRVEAPIAIGSWYLTTQEVTMNAFVAHHQDSIQFGYRSRILLNGLIQPFQQPERVLGFFVPTEKKKG